MNQQSVFVTGLNSVFTPDNRQTTEYKEAFCNLLGLMNTAREYEDQLYFVNETMAESQRDFYESIIAPQGLEYVGLSTADVTYETGQSAPDSFLYYPDAEALIFFDSRDFDRFTAKYSPFFSEMLCALIEDSPYFRDESKAKEDFMKFVKSHNVNRQTLYA